VTGDFNFGEEDPSYRVLTSGTEERPGLGDTRRLSVAPPYGSNHTFNGFSQDVTAGARIDFIFVRNTGPVLRYAVISDKWDGRFVSDHNAVAADILVRKK
jgi:endonuclease/exonuclease/phosphatase family metal-dependent hydrolase